MMDSHKTLLQFGKAQISSLIATLVDFVAAAFAFQVLGYLLSALIGGLMGGVTNGVINYQWTYKGSHRRKMHILWRYSMVWIGSLVFNTLFTSLFVNLLSDVPNQALDSFMLAKVLSGIFVAFCWNFLMQKYFVY